MIYLDKVTFIKKTKDYYDPDLGEQVQGELEQTTIECNVTDLGVERSVELFGDIKEQSIVVIPPVLTELPVYDYIQFKNKSYTLIRQLNPKNKTTLIFKESKI